MDYLTIFLLGAGIAAVVRSGAIYLYKGWFPQGFAGDSAIHFSIIKQLKKNPNSRYIDQYVIKDWPMSYPLAFHRISKLFPLRFIEKYAFTPNLFIFIFATAAFFAYLHYIEKNILRRDDFDFLIVAAGFYLFSTANLNFDGPNIAYIKLSERLLARVTCGFFFLCLLYGTCWHDMPSALFAVPLGAIALASSWFARQAILFATPLLSLILLDLTPMFCLMGSFALALLFSRGYFVLSMKHTVMQWLTWKTNVKKGKFIGPHLSRFINISAALAAANWRRALWNLREQEPVRLMLYCPELIMLAILLLGIPHGTGFNYLVFAPVIATLIVYLLTSTDFFNHLGESYRYVEYNLYFLLPALIGHAYLDTGKGFFWAGSIVYVIQVTMVVGYLCLILTPARKYPTTDVVAEFLAKAALPAEAVIFPVSINVGADICARTDCKSFWYQPGGVSKYIYDYYFEELPLLKKDFLPMFKKHKVTHVVCSKAMLHAMDSMVDWKYDFSGLNLLYEDGNYIAYSVPASLVAD